MPLEVYKVNECVVPQRSNTFLRQFFLGGKLDGLGGKLSSYPPQMKCCTYGVLHLHEVFLTCEDKDGVS